MSSGFESDTFTKKYGSSLIVFIFLLICNNCTTQNIDEKEKVNNVIYKLIEADNHSNLQAVLNSYSDSVEFYPAGKPFTKGIRNVQASYEKLFSENKLSITTRITATKIFGNDAMVTGINKGIRTRIADSSVVKLNDEYIAILSRNSEGEWKIDKLIWSSIQ